MRENQALAALDQAQGLGEPAAGGTGWGSAAAETGDSSSCRRWILSSLNSNKAERGCRAFSETFLSNLKNREQFLPGDENEPRIPWKAGCLEGGHLCLS